MSEITQGGLYKIFTENERFNNPVNDNFQIFNIKKTGDASKPSILAMIHDGTYHTKALLREKSVEKYFAKNLQVGDVIKVLVGEAALLTAKKKCVLLIDDYEIVSSNGPAINMDKSQLLEGHLYQNPHLSNVPQLAELAGGSFAAQSVSPVPTSASPPPVPQPLPIVNTSTPNAPPQHQARKPSSMENKNIFAIEQLSPYQNLWTIKARVSFKSDMKKWSNQKGEGKLFNVNFLDETGEIRATAFNDNAEKYFELLQEGKIYYVTKGRIQPARPNFSNLKHPYEIQLDRDSDVTLCTDGSDNVPKLKFDIVKLNDLDNVDKSSTIDVMGVIQTVAPAFKLQTKAGKTYDRRDVTIADDTGVSINIGLWNKPALDFNLPEGSVIVAKGCKVTDFNGKSLSMIPGGHIVSNPETQEAYALKGWYDHYGRETKFQSMQKEYTSSSGGNQFSNISERKTIQQAKDENLGRSERGDFFNIKGNITFVRAENFAYPACSSEGCQKKVIEQPDGTWRCEKCNINHPSPRYRYTLSISVFDETDQIWLTLFDDQATTLLGISANELTDMKNNGEDLSNFFNKFQMSEHNFRIRAREDNYNNESRIRYSCASLGKVEFSKEVDYLSDLLMTIGH